MIDFSSKAVNRPAPEVARQTTQLIARFSRRSFLAKTRVFGASLPAKADSPWRPLAADLAPDSRVSQHRFVDKGYRVGIKIGEWL